MSDRLVSKFVWAMGMTVVWLGGTLGCAHGVFDPTESSSDGLSETACGDSCTTTSSSTTTATTSTWTTTSTTSSTTSTTSATTTTSSDGCDNRGSCDACANCAITVDCSAQWDGCMANTDCSAFMDCLSGCADDTCANDCATTYPAGMDLYMQMVTCAMCQACPNDCQSEGQGLCSP